MTEFETLQLFISISSSALLLGVTYAFIHIFFGRD